MSYTLFKYADPTPGLNSLYLTNAQAVSGFTSLMWVERYRDAGEFTIVAPVSSGLRTKLPLGALISHTGTQELMVVESHEIDDTIDGEVLITVTGRSFETFMEQRVVSYNGIGGVIVPVTDALSTYYFTSAAYSDQHAVTLIEQHMTSGGTPTTQHISNLRAVSQVPASTGDSVERELKITNLYSAVLELLSENELGIRSVRPGPTSGLPTANDIGYIIHKGEDVSATVAFSHASGDIVRGQYLWSNKLAKTSVLTQGASYRAIVESDPLLRGYEVRCGYLDASDIDTGVLGSETVAIQARGKSYLGQNKQASIARVEISPKANRLRYRQDYNVGDLVGVNGNYGIDGVMRVVEHVEIIDETGQSSYPTLQAI